MIRTINSKVSEISDERLFRVEEVAKSGYHAMWALVSFERMRTLHHLGFPRISSISRGT